MDTYSIVRLLFHQLNQSKINVSDFVTEFQERVPELEKLLSATMLEALPANGPYVSVIVEPRKHELLPFVMKNVAYYLTHWPMYLFHSTENLPWLQSWLPANHKVHL